MTINMNPNGIKNTEKARDPTHDKWLALVNQQRAIAADQESLIMSLIHEKQLLSEKMEKLEFDNWTMRTTLSQMRLDGDSATKELASIKNDQSLVVCLLDGDGAIFSPEYLKQGEHGGRRAAEALANGLIGHFRSNGELPPPGMRIMTFIFLAKTGLETTLERLGICSPEDLTAFFKGFVQAHPTFNIIDAGPGKEKADHKLREHLDIFLRNPQTSKIFFGGSHDNGYVGNLVAAQTNGYIKKIVILRSYATLAREIQNLHLPSLDIPGLFLPNKLPGLLGSTSPPNHYSPVQTPTYLSDGSLPNYHSDTQRAPASPRKHPRSMRGTSTDHGTTKKRHPAPCNFKYLGAGCTNKSCPYGHDYELPPEELETMRTTALRAPCRFANENKKCTNAKCHLGHKCPRGPECEFFARGQCKFTGKEMHTRSALE